MDENAAMKPITIEEAYAVYDEQPTPGEPPAKPLSAEEAAGAFAEGAAG